MLEDFCEVTLSINFAKSEDSEASDSCSSPHFPFKNGQRYKCFRCHGTSLYNCKQCSNSGSVSNSNPMVQLFQAVLMRKLKNRKEEGPQVEIIKEEEEEVEEKRILCSFCELECQVSLYDCQKCHWFHVCPRCENRHSEHIHKVTRNISSLCGQSFDLSIKLCYNCGNRIQNCYSFCKTCQKEGNNYWICDVCSDKNVFLHEVGHIMEPVIDYESFKDANIETVSQEFQEEEGEEEFNQSIQIFSEKQAQDHQEEFSKAEKHLRLDKKNSSIAQYFIQNDDLLIINSIEEKRQEIQQVSRVRFDIEDGLFTSCDYVSEAKISSKNILKPPTVLKNEDRFSCTISQSSRHSTCKDKENQLEEPDFLFSGYQCDICECQPIRNIRFHCSKCEDFDVCTKCFQTISKTHLHSQQNFEKIDGKQLRQKAVQKAMNCRETILQTSLTLTNRKSTRSKTLRLNSGFS